MMALEEAIQRTKDELNDYKHQLRELKKADKQSAL
jgi:hypothetical protein